jgi:hypothetical protein
MLAAPSDYERRFFKGLTRHGHLNYFDGLLFLALIDSFYSFRESFSMPRVSLDFVVEELRSRLNSPMAHVLSQELIVE